MIATLALETSDVGAATAPRQTTIAAILLAFVAAWMAYGLMSHAGMVLHDDVTEAYVWGQEFQLGYNQHPPFWAWIAGLWFLLFPNREWAFMLLAVVNSAVGLLGAWYLLGRFAAGPLRMAAWLLLLCTPFYTFRCYLYNANTIFLSIWPWTLYCFMCAMDRPRLRDAILFGGMVGIALLSKYYAITLALTCLVASHLHPNARPYWRSASPWISGAVATLLLLPHVAWLVANDAPPIQYALGLTGRGPVQTAISSVLVLGELAALQAAVPILIWLTRRPDVVHEREPGLPFLAVLVLLPVLLTILFGICFGLKIRGAMVIGIFPLAPLLLIRLIPGADPTRLVRWTSRVVVVSTVLILIVAPAIARLLPRPSDNFWQLPLREAAQVGESLWHETTGKPLAFVGGSHFYSNAAAFYSDDRPSGFVFLDFRRSPWVTPEKIRQFGLLAICTDDPCREAAASLGGPHMIHRSSVLTHTALGTTRGTAAVDFYVIPPSE